MSHTAKTQAIVSQLVATVMGVYALAATKAGLIVAATYFVVALIAFQPANAGSDVGITYVITSNFGDGYSANGIRRLGQDGSRRPHQGTDFGGKIGDLIVAMAPGVVRYSGWNDFEGNVVTIEHGQDKDGKYIRIACLHLQHRLVSKGQSVNYGDPIGTLGQSGKGSGRSQGEPAHVHCELAKSTTRYFDKGTWGRVNLRRYFFGEDLICYGSKKTYPDPARTGFKVVVPVICK